MFSHLHSQPPHMIDDIQVFSYSAIQNYSGFCRLYIRKPIKDYTHTYTSIIIVMCFLILSVHLGLI